MKEFVGLIAALMLAALVIAGVAGLGYGLYAVLGPRYEASRREIVEQSKSFRDGAIRNIRDYEVRWRGAASPEQKAAIRAAVFHEINSYPEDALPPDLRAFVNELRTGG